MEWWGDIVYSKTMVNGKDIVVINDFEFIFSRFKDWILHKSKHA